eukprot:gene8186-8377_t
MACAEVARLRHELDVASCSRAAERELTGQEILRLQQELSEAVSSSSLMNSRGAILAHSSSPKSSTAWPHQDISVDNVAAAPVEAGQGPQLLQENSSADDSLAENAAGHALLAAARQEILRLQAFNEQLLLSHAEELQSSVSFEDARLAVCQAKQHAKAKAAALLKDTSMHWAEKLAGFRAERDVVAGTPNGTANPDSATLQPSTNLPRRRARVASRKPQGFFTAGVVDQMATYGGEVDDLDRLGPCNEGSQFRAACGGLSVEELEEMYVLGLDWDARCTQFVDKACVHVPGVAG